jgi:hypothetical protein
MIKMTKRLKSRSDCHQKAERLLIGAFSHTINRQLSKRELIFAQCKVQIDGFFEDEAEKRIILAEAWAHVGKAKGSQPKKVLTDLLKLVFVAEQLAKTKLGWKVEKYLIFADYEAAKVTNKDCWGRAAAEHFGVTSRVVPIDELRNALLRAQTHQDLRAS